MRCRVRLGVGPFLSQGTGAELFPGQDGRARSPTRGEPCPAAPRFALQQPSARRRLVRAKRGLAREPVLAWSGPLALPRRAHAPAPESWPGALSGVLLR